MSLRFRQGFILVSAITPILTMNLVHHIMLRLGIGGEYGLGYRLSSPQPHVAFTLLVFAVPGTDT